MSSKLYRIYARHDQSDGRERFRGYANTPEEVTMLLQDLAQHDQMVSYRVEVADVEWRPHMARRMAWIDV